MELFNTKESCTNNEYSTHIQVNFIGIAKSFNNAMANHFYGAFLKAIKANTENQFFVFDNVLSSQITLSTHDENLHIDYLTMFKNFEKNNEILDEVKNL